MTDPLIGAAAGAVAKEAAAATGGVLSKLLGPAATAQGEYWGELARTRAARKLLEKTEGKRQGRQGYVNPRVAATAIQTAAFSDEEIMADYLSGVVASSFGGSDRGAPWASLIARLSSDQLRVHYALYAGIAHSVTAHTIHRLEKNETARCQSSLIPAMTLMGGGEDDSEILNRIKEAADGLVREGLIGAGIDYFAGRIIPRSVNWSPNLSGLRLLAYGLGRGDGELEGLADQNLRVASAASLAHVEIEDAYITWPKPVDPVEAINRSLRGL